MSEGINLVSSKDNKLEKQLFRLKILRVLAIISLVTIASVSVVVFIVNFTLPLESVKKDKQTTLSDISFLHKKLVKYYLINDRVKNISDLISKRKDYSKSSSVVLGKVTQDLTVDSLEVEENMINISVSGVSLIPMNQLIDDTIKLSDEGKSIKNLTIQSLVLNARSQRYTLTLQADIP